MKLCNALRDLGAIASCEFGHVVLYRAWSTSDLRYEAASAYSSRTEKMYARYELARRGIVVDHIGDK